jgi:hypothetical protein
MEGANRRIRAVITSPANARTDGQATCAAQSQNAMPAQPEWRNWTLTKNQKRELVGTENGRGERASVKRNPLTETEIPRLPACVVRGADGAVTRNVVLSWARFEKNRDALCQKGMEDVRGA